MTARRMTLGGLDVVLQEKARGYLVDPSGEACGERMPFKPQDILRTLPRPRAGMYQGLHGGFLGPSSEAGREGLRGGVFPGPAFRPGNPACGDDSCFQQEGTRTLELSHSDAQEQAFGPQKAGTLRIQDRKFALQGSWEHAVAQQAWPRSLGPFSLPRVLEKEALEKESRGYAGDGPGETEALLRAAGGGTLEAQGLLPPEAGTGKLGSLRNVSSEKGPSKTQGTSQSQKNSPSPDVTLGAGPGPEDIQFPAQQVPLGLELKSARFRRRRMHFEAVDKADVFSRFGLEIIRWAGFHTVRDDVKFSQLFQTLFEPETETCAKTLASFKCCLKPEHRDFCFFTIKFLKHAALKTPRVDNEFLNLLLDRGAVKTKNCFFEIIKPFDKYMMRLQDRLLKSVTPLLMACNAYELSVKMKTLTSPLDLAVALETTNSLCRKSLALLGQTFSLASSFRQEKILEAVGLQDIAPSPATFPNFEDSMLFGREYVDHLKAWLLASGCPLRVKKAPPESTPQEQEMVLPPTPQVQVTASQRVSGAVPQRADHRVVAAIEQLVARVVEGSLSPKERAALQEDPAYWFLSDEDSLEYKYYKLKLAETQRLSQTQRGAGGGQKPTAVECAVRAMLYARAVRSLKKKLQPWQRRGPLRPQGLRGRKAERVTAGTQTPVASGVRLKHPSRQAPGTSPAKLDANAAAQGCPPDPASGPSPELAGAPRISSPCLSADVDLKTLQTAEKLARFVAQVGPEIEQFSIENSADNPDLWFLRDPDSSAFKFYRKKVLELCPSIRFSSSPTALQADTDHESRQALADPETAQQEAGPRSPTALLEEEEEGDEEEEEDEEAPGRQGRASRSEHSEGSPCADGLPGAATEGEPAAGSGQSQAASGSCFPRKRMSSKSLRVGLIPAPKRVCLVQEPEVHEPVRIAYDRPRGRPAARKKKPKDLEFVQQKLTDRNLGFQMLQKMGWKEGRGLGSCGKGIQEPVSMGPASEGEGLGADGQEQQEDTFDVFRQRMMQIYRHKRAGK
ncbi:SURP and G-patch domain-containing protein 2 [Ochotona princeps]|uniref:SURP and G-patch domain-containing protein 2 n=1 Tax=Ochotona princeps TaxID=9978 RepID=UPI002714C3F8|nr:SURP and G-patch domain-containing protein 2 [Ochotona princeps]